MLYYCEICYKYVDENHCHVGNVFCIPEKEYKKKIEKERLKQLYVCGLISFDELNKKISELEE